MTIPSSLISVRVLELLRILSNSDRPLTIHEIKLKMNPSVNISESEISELINSMESSSDKTDVKLFRWDQIPGNPSLENKVCELLLNHIPELSNIKIKNFEFKKNNTNDILTLLVNGNPILEINRLNDDPSPSEKRNYSFPNHPKLKIINSEKTIRLLEDKEDQIKLQTDRFLDDYEKMIHSLQAFKSSFYFLNSGFILEISKLEQEIERLSNIEKNKDTSKIQVVGYSQTPQINSLVEKLRTMRGDPNNKRYYLTISGLILYLINEMEDEKVNGIDNSNIIANSIRNLSRNYLDEFPFLYNYNRFEELFSKINPENTQYGLDVLKEIARNLKDLLNSNIDFLNYWVNRKYHNEIMLYLLQAINRRLLDDDKNNTVLMQQYSLKILPLLQKYLKDESDDIVNHIEYIDYEDIDSEELARGFGVCLD